MKKLKKTLCFVFCVILIVIPMQMIFTVTASADTSVTYTFTQGGMSGNNGNASIVTDPGDTGNSCVRLYTPNGNGYNMELAASDTSTSSPYILKPATTYHLKYYYKVGEGSSNANICVYLGSQAAYSSSKPKYNIHSKSFTATSADTQWLLDEFDFTTSANLKYNEYDSKSTNTSVINRLYFVANGSACTVYVDNVTITEKATPAVSYDSYEINSFTHAPYASAVVGSAVGSAKVSGRMFTYDLNGNSVLGYNFIFNSASGSGAGLVGSRSGNNAGTQSPCSLVTTSGVPIALKDGCSYRISVDYLPEEIYSEGNYGKLELVACRGLYQDGWSASTVIDTIFSVNAVSSTWKTASCTFTADLSSDAGRKYLLIGGKGYGKMYLDNIKVEEIDPSEGKKAHLEVSDFTSTPYSSCGYGSSNGTSYVGVRYYSTTDNGNSVFGYHYEIDLQADLIGETNNGSGLRGQKMGTNGSTPSATTIVDKSNTPFTLVSGKSYRIKFKYKVTQLDPGKTILFHIYRGKYQSGWTTKYNVSDSAGDTVIAAEFIESNDWIDAEYTFTADFASNADFCLLQLGIAGYGTLYLDDFVIDEIDESEVVPLPSSTYYTYSFIDGNTKVVTESYSGSEKNITVPYMISGRPLYEVGEFTFLYNYEAESITVPEPALKIGNWAFEYSESLKTVNLPKTVNEIGKLAFFGCPKLEAINVAADNTAYTSVNGVLYTKDMKTLVAYPAAKSGTTFTVPSSVENIAEGAFAYNKNLETVVLPSALTEIDARVFCESKALKTVDLSRVESVGVAAFKNCASLKNINAADDLVISEHSFYGCSSLYSAGDLSGNGQPDISDAVKLVKYLVGSSDGKLSAKEKLAADMNGDGKVDLADSAILDRHLAKWNGYSSLPCAGYSAKTPEDYVFSGSDPELVINLSENKNNIVSTAREIEYDPNKEDISIVLIIGQSNSTTGVGYISETGYYQTHEGKPTEEPVRPAAGTVFSGPTVTELNDSCDAYYLSDPKSCKLSGYSPAIGKELYDNTGTKVVLIQGAKGAVGMHEWVKNPGDYYCTCSSNGGGKLYHNAIINFTKSYQKLSEQYNVVFTTYVYNQGEHEEVYGKTEKETVHNAETYYDALLSMHGSLLSDCALDCGGIVVARSWYVRYWSGAQRDIDTPEHSRAFTMGRAAQYRAANDCPTLFIYSNYAEKMDYTMDDPSNTIHYAQNAYNGIGTEAGKSMSDYIGTTDSEFTGVAVYNKDGVELARFDSDGKLVAGSRTVRYSTANSKLQIVIQPMGTFYTYDFTESLDKKFVNDFGEVDWNALSSAGYDSFELAVNAPAN